MTAAQIPPLRADFGIEVKFQPDTPDPARVFRAMSALIDSFQRFDKELVNTIDSKIEPVLILEDIQVGSLRTWLRSAINTVDDSALNSGDWKQVVGAYMLRAKYIVIKKLENKTEITSRTEIKELEAELLSAAEATQVKRIPMYHPIPESQLIETISNISASLAFLQDKDSAKLLTADGEANFNITLSVSPDSLRDLLVKETLTQPSIMILKVKRPDYLGDSMWDFKFGDHPMQAKITHRAWLDDFQSRKVDVRPGDAIRARVSHSVAYGYDSEVISEHYEVLEVIEVIPLRALSQPSLLEGSNE